MGEPIRLWRGKEEVTVNGRAEADVLVAKGWMVGPRPADVEPVKAADVLADAQPVAPAHAPAPDPAPKPVKKKAGEYGVGSQPATVVTKDRQAEVKAERAKDKEEGARL